MSVKDNVYTILMWKSLGPEDKGKLNSILGLSLTWGVGIDLSGDGHWAGRPGFNSWQEIFLYCIPFRPVLRPTQPCIP
jgi:hypothetical protein